VFARDEVAVLVHGVAEGVQDVRPDDQGKVLGGGGVRGEADVEVGVVGAGHRDDVVDRDGAAGAGEAHLVGGKAGRVHRLVEGHPHATVDLVLDVAARGAEVDPGPLDVERDHVLVAGDLAGDQVAVLVHGVAERVEDVGPDDQGKPPGGGGGEGNGE